MMLLTISKINVQYYIHCEKKSDTFPREWKPSAPANPFRVLTYKPIAVVDRKHYNPKRQGKAATHSVIPLIRINQGLSANGL